MVVRVSLGTDRDTAKAPSIDLPNEAGVFGLIETARQHRFVELGHVENLPAAAVGEPRDDIAQLWICQDVEQGGWEGRLVAGAGLAGVALPVVVGAGRIQTSAGSVEGLVDVLLVGVVRNGRAVDVLRMDEAKLQRTARRRLAGRPSSRSSIICTLLIERRRRRSRGSALAVVLHVLDASTAARGSKG